MSNYPEPHSHGRNEIKIGPDLSNYVALSDLLIFLKMLIYLVQNLKSIN